MAFCPRDLHLKTLVNGVVENLADLSKSVAVVDMERMEDTSKLYEASPRCILQISMFNCVCFSFMTCFRPRCLAYMFICDEDDVMTRGLIQ